MQTQLLSPQSRNRALLAVPALLFLSSPDAERFAFTPEAGTAVRRTWVTEHVLTSDRMALVQGEKERLFAGEMLVRSKQTLDVVDSILSVENGRATSFRRSFDTVNRTAEISMVGANEFSSDATSPLEGTSVMFTWSPGEGDYGRYFDAKEVEEHHLAGLRADLDARALLPSGEVEPGATWSIEPAVLRDVLAHGGAIEFKEPEGAADPIMRSLRNGVGGGLDRAFGGTSRGTATMTFERIEEEEGRRIAILGLHASVTYSSDLVEHVRREMLKEDRERRLHYEEAKLSVRFEGLGVLRWDLAANEVLDLKVSGREMVIFNIAQRSLDDGAAEELQRQEMTMSGSISVNLTSAPAEPRKAPGPK